MRLSSEHRDWLRLALVPGVGTAHFIRLLARFRTPANVLGASLRALEESVGPALAQRIVQYADVAAVDEQERLMDKCGAHLVTLEDPEYPMRLAEIYDPPLALFVRGHWDNPEEPCMAVVGTRKPTPYGIRMAERFAHELAARGVAVVSGMALGIDAAAHRGAIEGGGRTVAVLGCGVDVLYPPQHDELMQQIIEHGCVMSQFPMGMRPDRGNFPYRNRIISGMSHGALVVEAPTSSGALITARQAAEQGREVFAIPGQLGVDNSEGPHLLIQEGARLVTRVEDILGEFSASLQKTPHGNDAKPPQRNSDRQKPSPSLPEVPHSAPPEPTANPPVAPPSRNATTPINDAPQAARTLNANVSALERQVLASLSPSGSHVDEIANSCRLSVSDALSSLTLLELKGLVRQFSGKRFAPR
ncbi:MAG TPA: DNA-processing protein DprA [Candidatus Hydrogenedentes bacterium]|nr:DNA-processing protein DprA [Candidatus Hydrogenedentota bacterium]